MRGWTAIVPIKPADERKSRLALDAAARIVLTEAMLARVLAALAGAAAVADVVLLTRDRPKGWDGGWFADGGTGLNEELARVARAVAGPIAVLHADLPAISCGDVDALLAAAESAGAIAPDRHGRGTNALALARPAGFAFAFGADSLARHRAAVPDAPIVTRTGLAFDIDDADDLAEAIRHGWIAPEERRAR